MEPESWIFGAAPQTAFLLAIALSELDFTANGLREGVGQ
jgi:protein-disulfide isomerase-like protein with CxxC motif